MSPSTLRTTRRTAAVKAAQKFKIFNETDATENNHRTSKRNKFENQATVPFGKSFVNAQKKKGKNKGKDVIKAKKTQTKAQAKAAPLAGRPFDAIHHQQSSKETELQRAARLAAEEEEETRIRERQAYLQRRAARMVHSDKKMIFSRRTCYNMGNKKHPDSPDHSPVKAQDLRYAFNQMQVVRIHRSTRKRDTTIKFKNVE